MPENRMKWRLPEVWTVIQANGSQILIQVTQDGNTLAGTTNTGQSDCATKKTGFMSGSIDGNTINLSIYWPDESVAELHGSVSASGKAQGTISIRQNGHSSVHWHAEPDLSAWE